MQRKDISESFKHMILHSSLHSFHPYMKRRFTNDCNNRCAILYSSSEAWSTVFAHLLSYTDFTVHSSRRALTYPLTLTSTNGSFFPYTSKSVYNLYKNSVKIVTVE